MSHRSRLAPALLALALMSASPVLSQAGPGAATLRSTSFGEALRSFLPDFLVRLWGEEGCGLDPYGSALRQTAANRGSSLPHQAIWAKEGCRLDPYGRCVNQIVMPLPNGL
jgi:hypothetical protein